MGFFKRGFCSLASGEGEKEACVGVGKGVGEGLRKGWGGLGFLYFENPV